LTPGITHAAVWAACSSFIAHNTTPELRPSAQSFLKGIHHGFGRFCGAVFGGMLIKEYGIERNKSCKEYVRY
jgi:predicted MFS family arabinose efflux permease